jgi:hypothetical protein
VTNRSTREDVLALLSFYRRLSRPLSVLEAWRALPHLSLADVFHALVALENDCAVVEGCGFYAVAGTKDDFALKRRVQDLRLDVKWKRLARYARWFRHLPFIDFALVSGSMALGNVTPSSDFDLVVGVRAGRMFTARYAALALFALLGARRRDDASDSGEDKLCFNHFLTPSAYAKPPHNVYRRELYRNLIPLWGDRKAVRSFVRANRWCGAEQEPEGTERHLETPPSAVRHAVERFLGGAVGDCIERRICAPVARQRLARYVAKNQNRGRVVVSDAELEFHFSLPYES